MLCNLDDLKSHIVAHTERDIYRHRYLRKAELSIVFEIGGSQDLEGGDENVGHVGRSNFSRPINAHVDVKQRLGVSLEPPRLH